MVSSVSVAALVQLVVAAVVTQHQYVNAEVISLTTENFGELTAGKVIFLKMYAPWCGHCQAMAEDFEKLANDWEGHEHGLVAQVDCTDEESEELCQVFEVEGYPSIFWGEPESPEAYEGDRTYAEMSAFAKENISKPLCSVKSQEYCSGDDKATVEGLLAKSIDELQVIDKEVVKRMSMAQTTYDAAVEKLSAEYESITNSFNVEVDKVRNELNYKYVLQALEHKGVDLDAEEGEDDVSDPAGDEL